jgi:hypothetical protein
MTTSLKKFILGTTPATPEQLARATEAWHLQDAQLPSDELAFPSQFQRAQEMREALSLALAQTVLLQSTPTKKAPTLRLAVEALRCT